MENLVYLERILAEWREHFLSLPEGTWEKKEAKEQVRKLQRRIEAVIQQRAAYTG